MLKRNLDGHTHRDTARAALRPMRCVGAADPSRRPRSLPGVGGMAFRPGPPPIDRSLMICGSFIFIYRLYYIFFFYFIVLYFYFRCLYLKILSPPGSGEG